MLFALRVRETHLFFFPKYLLSVRHLFIGPVAPLRFKPEVSFWMHAVGRCSLMHARVEPSVGEHGHFFCTCRPSGWNNLEQEQFRL